MDYEGRAGPVSATSVHVVHVPGGKAGSEATGRGAAVVVTALVCAMSGLVMGLALTAAQQPLLAFLSGALLAGCVVWFARPLMQHLP